MFDHLHDFSATDYHSEEDGDHIGQCDASDSDAIQNCDGGNYVEIEIKTLAVEGVDAES
jgi:hypothetical protein